MGIFGDLTTRIPDLAGGGVHHKTYGRVNPYK